MLKHVKPKENTLSGKDKRHFEINQQLMTEDLKEYLLSVRTRFKEEELSSSNVKLISGLQRSGSSLTPLVKNKSKIQNHNLIKPCDIDQISLGTVSSFSSSSFVSSEIGRKIDSQANTVNEKIILKQQLSKLKKCPTVVENPSFDFKSIFTFDPNQKGSYGTLLPVSPTK
jgi:hypothetical protein